MTTSGTVGLTTIDAMSVVEHSVRRAGMLAPAATAEMLISLRDNLYMILSNFVTKGLQLWCVHKHVYPAPQGIAYLNMDVGTVDVLNALWRNEVQAPATGLSPGVATWNPAAPVLLNGVNVTVPAGAYSFAIEGSDDNATWVNCGTRTVTPTVASTLAVDCSVLNIHGFWRVRETLTGTVNFTAAAFITAANEIPMSKLSRDDYTNLPNKGFQSQQPLQYWYDKQWDVPRMWLWPVPADSTHQIVVWAQRQMQDVGDLSNQIELPQRWLDAVIFELSKRAWLEAPKELVPADRYQILFDSAAQALGDCQDAEIDGAPVRLAPNIRRYTRL